MTESNGLTRSTALALLGLPADASPRDITHAYRRLAKATHPDRLSTLAAAATADPATSDSPPGFALLADAYHALTSTPETAHPDTSPPGRTPPPNPSTSPGAVSIPVRVRRLSGEPLERPPVVAGPVHITPAPPPATKPWRST
jgi:hypothetical protein